MNLFIHYLCTCTESFSVHLTRWCQSNLAWPFTSDNDDDRSFFVPRQFHWGVGCRLRLHVFVCGAVSGNISKRARLAKPVRTVDIPGVTFCANSSPWNWLWIASNRATRKSYYSPCFFLFFKYVILVHIHIIYRDVCVGG